MDVEQGISVLLTTKLMYSIVCVGCRRSMEELVYELNTRSKEKMKECSNQGGMVKEGEAN